MQHAMLLGTYTDRPVCWRPSVGMYWLSFNDESGALTLGDVAAEVESPAFITQHGSRIYCVNEAEEGGVSAFRLEQPGAALAALGRVSSDGVFPCHLAASNTWVAVANYMTGSVVTFAVENDGRLGARRSFVAHAGSGPNAKRQERAHAHEVWWLADEQRVLVPDLGSDRVYDYRVGVSGELTVRGRQSLPAGAGPRHVLQHPRLPLLYVVNELGNTVTVLERSLSGAPALAEVNTLPEDWQGASTTSEIQINRAGTRLYVSNRGHESIVSYDLDEAGRPQGPRWVSSGGEHPRHFLLDPTERFLLVANQDTDNILVYRLVAGHPDEVVCEMRAPVPVCLHFLG